MTVAELIEQLMDNCSLDDSVCIVYDQQEPMDELVEDHCIDLVCGNGKAVLLRYAEREQYINYGATEFR